MQCVGEELEYLVDMENCAQLQLAVGDLEQMTMSGAGTSATPSEPSNFHTALEECLPSGHDIAFGDRSGAGSCKEQKSEYFSPRVEEMMQSKSQFSSDLEHEIEHSKVHWSEVTGLSELSEDSDSEEEDNARDKEVTRENREVFAELRNDPQWRHEKRGPFFLEWPRTAKLGKMIAKGGQARIFEVLGPDGSIASFLLKVFRRGSRLSDLKKLWPPGILRLEVFVCVVSRGTMLDDGRFAFVMLKCWGDLRKLIDQAMQEKNNQGPPFPCEWNGTTVHVRVIMRRIVIHMRILHMQGIIHRDLKASNILLKKDDDGLHILVADFECSIGVVGTGFWRPPEILLALKNGRPIDFSKKGDVYSYGMICFELLTGRVPFEGELEIGSKSNELIIAGQRPKLPSDLDVSLKDLIEWCWNPIPNKRPSFVEIDDILRGLD